MTTTGTRENLLKPFACVQQNPHMISTTRFKPVLHAPKGSAWEAYCGYKYLCKIKHPTLRSVGHDAGVTVVDAGADEFVVVAVPDLRPEDLPQKALVLLMSITRVYQAVYQFQRAAEADPATPEYADFLIRVKGIVEHTVGAAKAVGSAPLPFSVANEPALLAWRKEFEADNDST